MTPDEASRSFRLAGLERPRFQADLLFAHARGAKEAFAALCRRRLAREPLEYLLGKVSFCGLTLACDRRALIPRPETEDLVLSAARRLEGHPAPRVADLGTGTGAIALALKARLPRARVVATDLSTGALDLARENARTLGLEVEFRQGPDLEPLGSERFDAILGNPPYVTEGELPALQPEVRDWEPHAALIAGVEGTEILARWIAAAPAHLQPGGCLAVEVGHTQAERVSGFFGSAGLSAISTTQDFAGIGRFVSGELAG